MIFIKYSWNRMCSKWNVPLNVLFLEGDPTIMYPFWNLIKMKCAQNRLCPFWNVLKMEFALFGMWLNGMASKCNVPFFECSLFIMWTKWNVLKKECDQSGMYSNIICPFCTESEWSCTHKSNVRLSGRAIQIYYLTLFLPSQKFQYHPQR